MFTIMAERLARPVRAPADDPGAPPADPADPPADPPAGAGDPPPSDPPAGDPPPSDPPKPWYEAEGALTAEEREWAKAKGYLQDDPGAVALRGLRGHMHAEKALGRDPKSLMQRPGEGQDVTAWMREHRETFGLPETAEGYEFDKPDLPDRLQWDENLEGKFRALAHDAALTPAQAQAAVRLYAEHMSSRFEEDDRELEVAKQEMMQELQRDWGDQFAARSELARQGLAAVAEKAGMDYDAQLNAMQLLQGKTGDAGVMKLFAAVGQMLGDDGFVAGGGVAGEAGTPAEARAELDRFMSAEGEYGKAFAAGDRARLQQLASKRERLTKLATGGR